MSDLHTAQESGNGVVAQSPLLSVCVPFKDYDVLPLATRLIGQAPGLNIEILFADDGSTDARIGQRLRARFDAVDVPFRLLHLTHNVGRSRVRNRLASAANGRFLLFLDADMLPDAADFLARYIECIAPDTVDAVCGGRSYRQVIAVSAGQSLYRYFSERTECLDAEARSEQPLWHLLTNNLCVRRVLVRKYPFHESFQGWGFEDADWALKLSGARVLHIDNPASHMGLIDERELIAKYDSSRENFRLISRNTPAFHAFALYRASRALAWMPLPVALPRALARALIYGRALPLRLRYLGIHLYRASLYAGVLRGDLLRPGAAHLP